MLYNQPDREPSIDTTNDYGPEPFVFDIDKATKQNNFFRSALWTGSLLQLTLMSIEPGGEIGDEMHPDVDQFLRVEQGRGYVIMGNSPDNMNRQMRIEDGYAIIIPAGTWHNIINNGVIPLKLYSIYAPVQHPFGTVQPTKEDADAAEMGEQMDQDMPMDRDMQMDPNMPMDRDMQMDRDSQMDQDMRMNRNMPMDRDSQMDQDMRMNRNMPMDRDSQMDQDMRMNRNMPMDRDM